MLELLELNAGGCAAGGYEHFARGPSAITSTTRPVPNQAAGPSFLRQRPPST